MARTWVADAMRPALALVAAMLALWTAGCTDPPEDEEHEELGADSFHIEVQGFPSAPVLANTTFNFTDVITGGPEHVSDHIGAHFGPNSTTSPSTTAYPSICAHTGGSLPGSFQVTCTAPSMPGTYYLRGHARIIEGNVTNQWWSDEQTLIVV
jgi:hypothetical protein